MASHRAAQQGGGLVSPRRVVIGIACALSSIAGAQVQREVYPEGSGTPRSLTPRERAWVAEHPILAPLSATGAPPGLVHCPPEYAPTQAVLVAWDGSASQNNVLTAMGREITTRGGAELWVVVDSTSERSSVSSTLTAGGVNMAKVRFFVRATDTIWIRDYGPRYIYEGGVRAIVDHTYNRPRPNDDAFPGWLGQVLRQPVYALPLVHGGGNFHLSDLGDGHATRLISNENPGLSEQQIRDLWASYQNLDVSLWTPFPTSIDSTQHIDMWMQVFGDRDVMISDWPNNSGSTQDQICDATAAELASRGYRVSRVPAVRVSGVHYTYTNVVICNKLLLVPSFSNTSVQPFNQPALDAWRAAVPGDWTVVPIDSQALVTSAGVMHCVMMHVPAPLGGERPTAYLRDLRGGERLRPGQLVDIRWSSDDNEIDGVRRADLQVSTDGGVTFPISIMTDGDDDGSYYWIVPDIDTARARMRLVVRDAFGNEGSDTSPADFVIGDPCAADFDGNGVVDSDDFFAFVNAYLAGDGSADINGDGTLDSDDFFDYLNVYFTGC